MTGPRLSVSALSSVRWSFDQDVKLWSELGLRWAGLMSAKLGDQIEARFDQLSEAGIKASTVVARRFDLADADSWEANRRYLHRLIDTVADHGGWSVYLTPGRTTGAVWDDVLETFVRAITPSVEYARGRGVRLAIEPTARVDVSFINNTRDAVDVAERTGIGLVADLCNSWMERDLEALLLRAAPYIALVQAADVAMGTITSPDEPDPNGRVPYGEGDLPLARLLGYIKETGYVGPVELELIGPLGEREGYEPVIRRGVAAADRLHAAAGIE